MVVVFGDDEYQIDRTGSYLKVRMKGPALWERLVVSQETR
jgi:hypothetical protein